MIWELSHRADEEARVIADRHYNRQKPSTPQFVPPGRCLVLKCEGAFWVTSWPFAQYVKHAWPGAWVCSAFRNERPDLYLSSDLVRQALAVTRWHLHRGWPPTFLPPAERVVPALGMVTFVDPGKTRRKRDPGRCFLRAGFKCVGETRGGLVALQIFPPDMPRMEAPHDPNVIDASFLSSVVRSS